MNKVLWQPSEQHIKSSQMQFFLNSFEGITNYSELHKFSVTQPEKFWSKLIDYFKIDYQGDVIPAQTESGFNSYGWFPKMKMNFAHNLLKNGADNKIALTFIHESGLAKTLTYKQLKIEVAVFQEPLKEYIKPGDVLACFMPNIPQTIIAMLATSSLGGIFTSTSCDFGVEGVVDRFSQSKPKVLVTVSGYTYNGKYISLVDRIAEIKKQLPSVQKVIVFNLFQNEQEQIINIDSSVWWIDFVADPSECKLTFQSIAADAPLYIMYSSGTTGTPKCIVHSQIGTLLQHTKELGLHCNLTDEKKIMYFTTCGWMMWNWLVSSLYFGANIYLYEGSPAYPSIIDFFEMINDEEINIFGTSPKFLKTLENENYNMNFTFEKLETILSTGAPLLAEQFDFVYQKIKSNLCLSSIAGGTDIIGCFMLGNPILPVYRGEIQSIGLGMDVASLSDEGAELIEQKGELVCKTSFPSRPLYFLDDPDSKKINKAYFNKFEGLWHHGDFITITQNGGVIVHGRSDTTLNPGGVRIGTAEIYRQLEQLNFIEDSICVGMQEDGDVSVVLFVQIKDSECPTLSDQMLSEIKSTIRKNTTPRHVPKYIYKVDSIPYTRSGKKMEMIISKIIAGETIQNTDALKNPECLDQYKQFATS